jgi:hypothetical protein
MRVEWEWLEGGRWGKLSDNPCIPWTFIIHKSSSNFHPLICLYDITLFFSIIKMEFKMLMVHGWWPIIQHSLWCAIMCTRFLSTTPIYNIGFWAHSFHWSSKLGMERNVMNVYCMICISLSTYLSILTKDFEICSLICSKFMTQGLLKGHVVHTLYNWLLSSKFYKTEPTIWVTLDTTIIHLRWRRVVAALSE